MPFRLDRALEVLESTPRTIEAWLLGLSEDWLTANEGPETFSPLDVLGHLIHGEVADWIPRARIILEHGEARPFESFDRFAFRRTHAGVPLPELVATFARLRSDNLQALRALDLQPAQLALRGTHPSLGGVTMEQLLASWVVHDLGHLAQIAGDGQAVPRGRGALARVPARARPALRPLRASRRRRTCSRPRGR